MRMLLHVIFPHEPFNAAVRDGTVGQKVKRILDDAKAEAVYFTECEGHRGVIMIVDVKEPAQVPRYAEPWFLAFDADVKFHIVMKPEELAAAGLEALGKKWA